jgi:hypothetical protein
MRLGVWDQASSEIQRKYKVGTYAVKIKLTKIWFNECCSEFKAFLPTNALFIET